MLSICWVPFNILESRFIKKTNKRNVCPGIVLTYSGLRYNLFCYLHDD